MKALVSTHFGPLPEMHLEERAKPVEKKGFTLVKMHAATVNPLSHQVRSGIVAMAKAPLVLSNDGSGIVEQSERFCPGTRVAIYGGAQLGITEDGMQQQWVLVEDKRIIALPDDFDLDEGAALPINYVTAYQAMTRIGNVQSGHKILISGASGSVGHALIQMSVALGAIPIAVVSTAAKAERAKQSGAQQVIDLSSEDLCDAVLAMTEGQGADCAFDPVGGELLGQLLHAVRLRGAVVSIGFVGGSTASVDVADIVIQEKQILGYDAWLETDEDVASVLDVLQGFIKQGLLRPSIDSVYPLEQFEDAYQRLNSRQATGTVLLHL
ncbi:TPA: zinc-binding alcohol dehydrogenase family protein [Yersinia enterocolitica]|uniref:quinone oxidoreductase family protein n=1 Tax=Yersinia enterocolitica TaxID=630 RepID=UPI00061C8505|nr:zinc-binding alcohol dehydrogenase family protein [Yersinia enterocolitica]EKN3565297.1 zinc-binding alcohol dehydrogenase family protein [Yersinia enterocolitica]EKN4773386.1 zinc-binding alcohol dehydrogenase family protein [Yersinia enterocolitica]EKN4885767.1 zinc-binding alcohol dehydrogenase family protein [Yersinia enterocolitica]EKN4890079.1 zinc-binding alcohol dehydrogenase family protein [Yersinia enterocolitica]EKN4902199.1 zinc-binding alcohol dehydrogenase family protein [Yers